MPQRDDKVGIHFGRISPECWERIQDRPGAIIEKAVQLLVEARRSGQVISYPSTMKVGISKKLWLWPDTVKTLNDISDQTGLRKTPLILAALDLYFADADKAQ